MQKYRRYKSVEELIKIYEKEEKSCNELLTDQSLYKLAHPNRVLLHPMGRAEFIIDLTFNDLKNNIVAPLFAIGISTQDIWQKMAQSKNKDFERFFKISASGRDGGFGSGSNGVSFTSSRYQMVGGRQFSVDDSLLEMLINTDISGDLPVSSVKLPYPVIYIEFGRVRDGKAGFLTDGLTGEHVIEGVYLCEVKDSIQGRILEVAITCSPNEKSTNIFDDHVEWLSLVIDEGLSIEGAIKKVHTLARNVETGEQLTLPAPKHSKDLLERHSKLLHLVMKCLLYINLPGSRKQEMKEGTQAQMKLMRAVSGAHKRKAEKASRRAHDYILVLPPVDNDHVPTQNEHGSPSPHWRRGHFRAQRYGTGLLESKIIWIAPVLVNFDEKSVTSSKDYIVK